MSRYVSEKLRAIVAARAKHCCEYCGLPESASFFAFQVDHIISRKHGGATTLDNLAWSCYPCNNAKGSDIGTVLLPEKSLVRLFNPREDIWSEHFEMVAGVVYPRTNVGEATLKILAINEIERIIERQAILGH